MVNVCILPDCASLVSSELTVASSYSSGEDHLYVRDRIGYLDSLAAEIGAKPRLWKWSWDRLKLLPTLLLGPAGMAICTVLRMGNFLNCELSVSGPCFFFARTRPINPLIMRCRLFCTPRRGVALPTRWASELC